ncbi:MAG: ParB/RepB/Spo0J family partition protein [Longimicrobiales bacterium]
MPHRISSGNGPAEERRRDRLGRGLGALLGDYLEEPPPEGVEVRRVPVGAIGPNPFQPRRAFSEEDLAELVDSIRENGLLQPIIVRPAPGGADAEYQLVAGERRWRALTRLGWAEAPAIIKDVDDQTLLVLALVENIQRSALSPLEEAEAYRQLTEEFGLSQAAVAETVGRDRSTVANTMRLLQLPPPVRRLVSEGALTAGHARALLGLASERRMSEFARQAADQGWSVRETEERVRRAGPEQKPKKKMSGPRRPRDPVERRLEEELQRVYGTPVRVRRTGASKGRIEVPFFDAEDFERVYELMTGGSATELIS